MVKKRFRIYISLSKEECIENLKKATCEDTIGARAFSNNSEEIIFVGKFETEKFKIRRRTENNYFPAVTIKGDFEQENGKTKIEGIYTNQYLPDWPLIVKIFMLLTGSIIYLYLMFAFPGNIPLKSIALGLGIFTLVKYYFFIDRKEASFIFENLNRIFEEYL